MDEPISPKREASRIVGISSLLLFLLGIGAIVLAIIAVAVQNDYHGAGMCLIASALAFGLLLNAFLRT